MSDGLCDVLIVEDDGMQCLEMSGFLRRAGLSVPKDIAVVGYDDILLAEVVDPPMTTVLIAKDRLGRIAAEGLIDSIENSVRKGEGRRGEERSEPKICRPLVLEPELVIRDSG